MTGRVQTLRSSVAGNRPTGRQPGELYVNWADSQLGVINASSAAQDLLPIRFFSATANYAVGAYVIQANNLYQAKVAITAGAFNSAQWAMAGGAVTVADTAPATPNNGQLWWDSVGGNLYVYYTDANSSQWVVANNGLLTALQLTGGTLTGPLILAADPTVNLGAATKQYVDGARLGSNRVDNGDMWIDQHNGGAVVAVPGANSAFCPDRFLGYNSQATSRFRLQQNLAAITAKAPGFQYFLGAQSTSAYTSAAADVFLIQQGLEVDAVSDLGFGAVGAQPVTVSFWARSSLTGNFSFCLQSPVPTTSGGTTYRDYIATYSLPTANTWTKIAIIIPGDTTNPTAWPTTPGNGIGLYLIWDLGGGSTVQSSTLNAWQTSAAYAATGAVKLCATNNATLGITGVKLEAGSVATPFPMQSLQERLARCQRYYEVGNIASFGYTIASNAIGQTVSFATVKRALATMTGQNSFAANVSATANIAAGGLDSFYDYHLTIATAPGQFSDSWQASAEI